MFTVQIDVFFGLPLFREAIKAIQDQTYQNLEIIISNNGADQEITDFILETEKADKSVKVITYEKNIHRGHNFSHCLPAQPKMNK